MSITRPLIIFFGLFAVALLLGLGARGRLDPYLKPRVTIEGATPLISISGAAAGKPIEVRDPLTAVRYTVVEGDSWSRIAKQNNVRDYNALAKHNGYIELKPGMQIEIPAELRSRE